MIRSQVKKIILQIFNLKIFNILKHNIFPGKIYFLKLEKFLTTYPWWNDKIVNWIDLFMIFFNIKKNANISFKDGFVFKNCSKLNWHLLYYYLKVVEKGASLQLKGSELIGKIKNFIIKFPSPPDLIEAIRLFYDIFANEEFGKINCRNKIVMDIGGYVGDSAIYFIYKGAKKVYVYEVNPKSYLILRENVEINKLQDKIIIFNKGVSNETKNDVLYLSKTKTFAGTYKDYISTQGIISQLPVELIQFKDALKEPIDILKMDCEGAEYDILENILNHHLLDWIKEGIVLETHNVDKVRNKEYLVSQLKKIGFKKIYFYGLENHMLYCTK